MIGAISDVCKMPHFTSMWYLEKLKGLSFRDSPSILHVVILKVSSCRCRFVLKDSYFQGSTALSDCPDDDGQHHSDGDPSGY